MPHTQHLAELARLVRGDTLRLLEAVPEAWLTWAPPGTSNHILWHAGHALWLQDALCIRRLTGTSELPDGWEETFGSNCAPVADRRDWPPRSEVHALLAAQLDRLLERFAADTQGRLAHIGPNTGGGWDLVRGILHGLHDEARHQGEMYLLLKLRRSRSRLPDGT